MSIVTDSSGKLPANVYAIHTLYRSEEELSSLYASKEGNYKALKEMLIEDIEANAKPMREKRAAISDEHVKKVLKEGGERAHAYARAKMEDVRKKVGISL
jgi:tryptophanyl-tRNA synthetase